MSDIRERIKLRIIRQLDLAVDPTSIADDAALFEPVLMGGLDLDSLAALEIIVGLSDEFNIQLDEVPKEAFETVNTLSSYIESKINEE